MDPSPKSLILDLLATVGRAHLNLYDTLERRRAAIEERHGGGPAADD